MKIAVPPEHIAHILNKLAQEGHDSYIVGGSVRDAVMGRAVNDWDVATTATPVEIAGVFPKTVLTGERFGTVTVVLQECQVEVTTFRADGIYADGRHPEEVKFVTRIDEDLSRRDFTINAMAASAQGDIIDPFGGIDDINRKLIRCVGGPNTRFSEDALRMFRALRFSAELGFKIEPETLQAIYANVVLAQKISSERIRIELEKVLLSQRPEIAGEMIKIGLLGKYVSVSGKSPEGLANISYLPKEPILRWSAFCALLMEMQYISSATELLQNLHLDGKTIKACSRALPVSESFPDEKIAIKRLLSKYDVIVVRAAAAISDIKCGGSALKATKEVLISDECFSLDELAIAGHDLIELGHAKGKGLGETLNKLLEHVINNPDDNKRDVLVKLAGEAKQLDDVMAL